MKNVLIVLDDFKYKNQEENIKETLSTLCTPHLMYTQYETKVIQYFMKLKYVGNFLTHISYWILSFSYAVNICFTKRYCQDKLFINPIVGIFYAFLPKFIISENIIIAGFLFEQKKNKFYLSLRKLFVNIAYKSVNKIIVYSNNELTHYSKMFPKLSDKFTFIPYGKDYECHKENDNLFDEPFFFSGGGSNRDYSTLCNAMKHVDIGHCVVGTRPMYFNEELLQKNISVKYDITLDVFGSWIKNADFFVLPLEDNELSAGHMALFEALKNGKIVIVADIASIRDYVDERYVLFYKPYSEQDLADKILYVTNNIHSIDLKSLAKQGLDLYNTQYTFISLLQRLIKIV